MTILGIVLAAGGSSRLGRPKQLVELDGEALVSRTTRIVQSARVDRVGVVVGAQRDDVVAAIAELGVEIIENDHWRDGMATSLRAGVGWARGAEAALICVCDQPRLTTIHLDALLSDYGANGVTVGSRYSGMTGVPAIIAAADFAALAALTGDRGARGMLGNARALDWEDGAFDVDTEADVDALIR